MQNFFLWYSRSSHAKFQSTDYDVKEIQRDLRLTDIDQIHFLPAVSVVWNLKLIHGFLIFSIKKILTSFIKNFAYCDNEPLWDLHSFTRFETGCSKPFSEVMFTIRFSGGGGGVLRFWPEGGFKYKISWREAPRWGTEVAVLEKIRFLRGKWKITEIYRQKRCCISHAI